MKGLPDSKSILFKRVKRTPASPVPKVAAVQREDRGPSLRAWIGWRIVVLCCKLARDKCLWVNCLWPHDGVGERGWGTSGRAGVLAEGQLWMNAHDRSTAMGGTGEVEAACCHHQLSHSTQEEDQVVPQEPCPMQETTPLAKRFSKEQQGWWRG